MAEGDYGCLYWGMFLLVSGAARWHWRFHFGIPALHSGRVGFVCAALSLITEVVVSGVFDLLLRQEPLAYVVPVDASLVFVGVVC
ncbi:hypothetical protein Dimus_000177 [Dionaea muscipula]